MAVEQNNPWTELNTLLDELLRTEIPGDPLEIYLEVTRMQAILEAIIQATPRERFR